MNMEIEPEIIEPDDPQLQVALQVIDSKEERVALIKAHSRLAIVKTIMRGLGVVAFFGFLSTCMYVTCGGAG